MLKDITFLKEASESRLEMSVILVHYFCVAMELHLIHRIATVHDQFEKELEDFTDYLDIAAHTSKRFGNWHIYNDLNVDT